MKESNIVLVVEGRQDEQFIRSFLDVECVITNGTAVPRETIDYLKSIQNKKTIVVLTDPDYPGMKIRQEIAKFVDKFVNVYIDKADAMKKGKVGVAESSKEVVLEALKHYSTSFLREKGEIDLSTFIALKLSGFPDSKRRREFISKHFHLGYNNAKSLMFKLNANKISKKELEEAMKNYSN